METFVLIPEQLSLQLETESLTVVAHSPIVRGFRFSPFQGTLRTDEKLSLVVERGKGDRFCYFNGFRAASWVRFLRTCTEMNGAVNLVEMITPGGQIMYEAKRPVDTWEELVLYAPDSPLNLAKAIKEAIFEQTMRSLQAELPLDLSTSVFQKLVSFTQYRENFLYVFVCEDPTIRNMGNFVIFSQTVLTMENLMNVQQSHHQ